MLPDVQFDPAAPARERILFQAGSLFYQQGIRATGIDRIIAEASVTKVTFYRHFPAKQSLVVAFLEQRHQCWSAAFSSLLGQKVAEGLSLDRALPATLASWFSEKDFRGCAFINTAAELGDDNPQCMEVVKAHKRAMRDEIATKLTRQQLWALNAICMLVEGAIVQVQTGWNSKDVIKSLQQALRILLPA